MLTLDIEVSVVLARDGRVFDRVLRRELISKRDFHEAMRMNAVDDVNEIALALLETNGHITILKKEK